MNVKKIVLIGCIGSFFFSCASSPTGTNEPFASSANKDIKPDVSIASKYNEVGVAHYSKGEYDQAITYFEKALEIRLEVLGPEHPDVATSFNNLGTAHYSKGQYDQAIDLLEKSLVIRLKKLGPEHPDVAQCYNNLGLAYQSEGKYDRAIGYYEKSFAIRLKKFGPEHPDVAQCYNNLGLAYQSEGKYDRAIGYYEKSLAICLKKLGPDHQDVAVSYNNFGLAYQSEGKYDRAIGYYEKALQIYRKNLGPDHPIVAASYNNLGGAYDAKGKYDLAIDFHRKALAIHLKTLSPDHRDVSNSYILLGFAYYHKGEYDLAISYGEKALAIRLKALGPEHPDVAIGYNFFGMVYHSMREYDQAISYYEKALAIRLKVLGPEHPDVAQVYNNLGAAYNSEGEYDRAIVYFGKTLAITLGALGPEHPDVATSYSNLGMSYHYKGEYDQAISCYEKALAICLKVLGPDHPDVALYYNDIGMAYYYKGDCDQGVRYLDKALAVSEKTGNRPTSLLAALNLGILDLVLKQYPEAKKAFRDGIAVIERARGETGAGKAEFTARNISFYYYSLVASAAMNDLSGMFEAAEAMRARGFLDRLSLSASLSAEGVSKEARTEMLALNDDLERLAAQRSEEIQKPQKQQDSQRLLTIGDEIQEKEMKFAEIDQSLMANSRYKELRKPLLASLQDAQQLVGENDAVLEYVLREEEKEQQSFCLVIRRSGAELVVLEKDFAYSKAVTDFREAIMNGTQDREELGAKLYERLIAAVERRLSGVGKLIIVPDGALAFLPFDALRKDSRSPYLCERYELSLAPSVSVLRMVVGRKYGSRASRWLAMGGARYSGEGTQAQRGRRSLSVVKAPEKKTLEYYAAQGAKAYYEALGIRWDDIPGTRDEVLAIEQTVYGGKGTRVVLGEQASEQLVKQLSASGELAQKRVLHFACHGIFDAKYPAFSAVVLSEVSGALKDTSTEDGYLTVQEVALLRLQADMVELSACETGLGKLVQGDGVIGLTRAFMVAGANGVGATLWVVDDLATKAFMVRVYGLVEQQGMSYAEAIVKVKREFITSKNYSDPYYWSPFVLYGK